MWIVHGTYKKALKNIYIYIYWKLYYIEIITSEYFKFILMSNNILYNEKQNNNNLYML